MTRASLDIAKNRVLAQQTGTSSSSAGDNVAVSFVHGNILQIGTPELDLGDPFDYIECSGVLHHLQVRMHFIRTYNFGCTFCLTTASSHRVSLFS